MAARAPDDPARDAAGSGPAPLAGEPDPGLVADLEGIDPGTAAMVLVHLAADFHQPDREDGEPRLAGWPESLAMEIIANNVFNDRDDDGDMLGRYRLLWKDIGGSLTQVTPRRPPADLLEEARDRPGRPDRPGLRLLGARPRARPRHPDQAESHDHAGDPLGEATIARFLELFARTPAELAGELRDVQGHGNCCRCKQRRCCGWGTMSWSSMSGT